MSALKTIAKSIQNNKDSKKSPRSQYILGVLAMSAIADKVMANEQPVQKEGVIIDVVKLLKEQGIAVTPENINDIVLALAEGQDGQLIDLGYGLYQFIPADAQAEISLQISSTLLDAPIITEASLIDFTLVTDSTTLFAEVDEEGEPSGFEFSIPMLGLLAVAAMGGNSNSAQAESVNTNPFTGAEADSEFSYADALLALSVATPSELTYSEYEGGLFVMTDATGGDVGGAINVTGSIVVDSTGFGVATFASTTPFFGQLWTAHDVVIQINEAGTSAELEMLFDWGATSDIAVTLDVSVTTNSDGQITSFTAVDSTPTDGIPGNPMDNGPFVGFSAAFSAATVTEMTEEDGQALITDLSTEGATLEGVAIDGPLESALIFFDLDGDDVLDSNEVFTVTDDKGAYTLTPNDKSELSDGNLVVRSIVSMTTDEKDLVSDSIDIDALTTSDTLNAGNDLTNLIMRASEDATVISPLTTILEEIADADEAVTSQDVLKAFGLSDTSLDINNYNPFADKEEDGSIKAENLEYATLTATIHVQLDAIAKEIESSASDITVKDAYAEVYSALIETVKEDIDENKVKAAELQLVEDESNAKAVAKEAADKAVTEAQEAAQVAADAQTAAQATLDAAVEATAVEAAQTAFDAAQAVVVEADTAKAAADTALTTANTAKTDADTALTTAREVEAERVELAADALQSVESIIESINEDKAEADKVVIELSSIIEIQLISDEIAQQIKDLDNIKIAEAKLTIATNLKDNAQVEADKANTAKTDADTALATANTAKTDADTTLNDATAAKTDADTALTAANTAKTVADTALTAANTAKTDADTALTAANTAKTVADTALTAANTAKTVADTDLIAKQDALTNAESASIEDLQALSDLAILAKADADAALATANTAKTDADTTLNDATAAKTDADTALTAANTAKTDADTALTAANTAKTDADTALTAANTAKTDADIALATANTAKADADAVTVKVEAASNAQNTADAALSTANQAVTTKTDADTALAIANTAKTEADTALTTATTAQADADTALNDATAAHVVLSTTEGSDFSMEDQLIQIRNMGPATAAEASEAEYGGADYSSPSDTQELIKFEMWLDTSNIASFDTENGGTATEILGYQFNIDWNTADVEGLGLAFIPGDLIGYNPNNIDNSSLTFNSTTGAVAVASSGAIVDTNPNNNLPFNGDIQSEKLVATFYMNPTDTSAESIALTMTDTLVVTDKGNITPADYNFPVVSNTATPEEIQAAEQAVTDAQAALDIATTNTATAQASADTASSNVIDAQAALDAAITNITNTQTTADQAQEAADSAASELAPTIMNLEFSGGAFEMRDTNGDDVGGATDVVGTMSIDMDTGAGTAEFSSATAFFGQLWTAHDITIQMTGDDTVTVNMLFDWGVTTNIDVIVNMGVAFDENGNATFTTLEGDDGIPGEPMDNGPFVGFNAAFSGVATPAAPEAIDLQAITDAADDAQDAANTAVSDAQVTADNATTTQTAAHTVANDATEGQAAAETTATNATEVQAVADTTATNATTVQAAAETAAIDATTVQAAADTAATDAAAIATDAAASAENTELAIELATIALTQAQTAVQTTADNVTDAQAAAATADDNATKAQTEVDTADNNTTTAQASVDVATTNTVTAQASVDTVTTNVATAQVAADTASSNVTDAEAAASDAEVFADKKNEIVNEAQKSIDEANDVINPPAPVVIDTTVTESTDNSQLIMSLEFSGGAFEMRDTNGDDVGGATDVVGTMSIDMDTGAGTAEFSSATPFFGQLWTAHDITIQMTGDDTMTVNMLFDWGVTTNINVSVNMGVAFDENGNATFTTLEGDDGIPGEPMDNGPFVGFNAAFSGVATPVAEVTDSGAESNESLFDEVDGYSFDLNENMVDAGDSMEVDVYVPSADII